jgi:branched-chain amino acid transport system ATP-binding protein
MLEVRNLSVAYGNVRAVSGMNLTVREGQLVALIGSNGAGKSSLLKAVSGLARAVDGEIRFDGTVVTNARPDQLVRRGLVQCPEGRRIFPRLTVQENLRAGAHLHPGTLAEGMDRAFDLFPRLRERRDQLGQSLSGGEQQMLAIGRALMARPRMLLLDEPSLGLAPVAIEAVFNAIARIRDEGATVLLVEQNAHLSLAIADYAYVMERGAPRLQGKGRDLAASDEVRRAYLGA